MVIQVDRGEVYITADEVLVSKISSCVSVCLYSPELMVGGMNHIFGSRTTHDSPSGKYIKKESEGYYYADNAVPKLLSMFKSISKTIKSENIYMFVVGGYDNEGPLIETLEELGLKEVKTENNKQLLTTRYESKYKFKLFGYCLNQKVYRTVKFDVKRKKIEINKKKPYSSKEEINIISF